MRLAEAGSNMARTARGIRAGAWPNARTTSHPLAAAFSFPLANSTKFETSRERNFSVG